MNAKTPANWTRHVLMVAIPLAVTAAALLVWLSGGRYVATENAYVKSHIAQVSAEIAGRIADVKIRDHDRVEAGDVLIEIDPAPFKLALQRADAEVDRARHQIRALIASAQEAQSELIEAETRAEYWQRHLERQQQLANRGVVASSKLEEVARDTSQATDRLATMRRKVERVRAELGQPMETAVDAHPIVREKIAAREQAALDLARTSVRAPISGTAVNVRAQAGEHIKAAAALFAIVDDREPWLEANFKETELTHVAAGQPVSITLDIYPDRAWRGRIVSISPATGAEFALLPPQNASGNWVKVVQRLPVRIQVEREAGDPPLRAGMTAAVSVDTGRERRIDAWLGRWRPGASPKVATSRTQPSMDRAQ